MNGIKKKTTKNDLGRLNIFKVTQLKEWEPEDQPGSDSKPVFLYNPQHTVDTQYVFELMDKWQMCEHLNCIPGLNVRHIDILVVLLYSWLLIFEAHKNYFKNMCVLKVHITELECLHFKV